MVNVLMMRRLRRHHVSLLRGAMIKTRTRANSVFGRADEAALGRRTAETERRRGLPGLGNLPTRVLLGRRGVLRLAGYNQRSTEASSRGGEHKLHERHELGSLQSSKVALSS